MAIDKSRFKDVGGRTDRNWPEKGTELSVGDSLEGRYVSKNENVGVNASNVYVLRVGDELVGVWGNTVLDAKFESVPLGADVAIEYLGKKKPKSGGKDYKDFFVGVDESTAPAQVATHAPSNELPDDEIPF